MEIFIRLFVWILNRTYGRQGQTPLYGSNPMDQKVLFDYEESRKMEREAQRQNAVVESFKSTSTPVHGAVDYGELQWDSYDKAVETSEQFVFYSGRSIAKIIEKSLFTNPQELHTFRRIARRYVANHKLFDA